jgi:hypothetical protein
MDEHAGEYERAKRAGERPPPLTASALAAPRWPAVP